MIAWSSDMPDLRFVQTGSAILPHGAGSAGSHTKQARVGDTGLHHPAQLFTEILESVAWTGTPPAGALAATPVAAEGEGLWPQFGQPVCELGAVVHHPADGDLAAIDLEVTQRATCGDDQQVDDKQDRDEGQESHPDPDGDVEARKVSLTARRVGCQPSEGHELPPEGDGDFFSVSWGGAARLCRP